MRSTPRLTFRRAVRLLGPGLITGASDDDPSGIAVYSQAGATYGNTPLWTVVLCLPFMIAIQQISDQTAAATGRNLGELIRQRFGRTSRALSMVLLLGLFVANTVNVAADLLAIGSGFNLLHLGNSSAWAAAAGVALMILVAAGTFNVVSRVFRILALSLLAYPIVLAMVNVDWGSVARASVGIGTPLDAGFWQLVVAVLGTTLSPYLLFWQSADRAEESAATEDDGEAAQLDDEPGRTGRRRLLLQNRLDVVAGMVLSEVVAFAIIAATASTIHATGSASINTAADAAQAFRPIAGSWATVLFAAGFIGTGLLAVPVLAGAAATAIAGISGARWGYDDSPRKAPLFYLIVGAGTLGGAALGLLYPHPIRLLVICGLINGVAAAPFIVLTLIVAQNPEVMRGHEVGPIARAVGWLAAAVMTVAGVVGIVTL